MNVLWLFDTCGYLFGPAIMVAGAAAVILCAWATFRSTSRRSQRRALAVAGLPMLLGLCGFLVGLIICWNARVPGVPWLALGKVCLAGAAVSAVPLIWALLLCRNRGNTCSPVAGES